MGQLKLEKFREHHQRHGQAVRWLRALPVGHEDARSVPSATIQRLIFGEADMTDKTPVLRWQSEVEIVVAEFGAFPVGTTIISVLPSEMPVGRNDRFIFIEDAGRTRLELEHGSTPFDELPHGEITEIVAIQSVWRGETVFAPDDDYRLSEGQIEWLAGGSAPAGSTPDEGERFGVEYSFRPVFEALGPVLNQGYIDRDGNQLTEWWALQAVKPE